MNIKIGIFTFIIVLQSGVALADSSVDCNSTCPDGSVMSSFADGTDVACVCVAEAEMDPTVEDSEIQNGGGDGAID